MNHIDTMKQDVPEVGFGNMAKATDEQISAWAVRHDLAGGLRWLREVFEDAQTLVQPAQSQEPLMDAIRAEPTELIHKWRVLELVKDHAAPQPQQEPVAWLHPANATCVTTDPTAYARGIPLYPSQPAQQEPVAWMTQARCFLDVREYTESEAQRYGWSPLFTSPQPAQQEPVAHAKDLIEGLYENGDPVSVDAAELLEQLTSPQPAQQEPLRPEDVIVEVLTVQGGGGFAPLKTHGVKLTHKPTGIVVQCSSERSQHRNREQALRDLERYLHGARPHPAAQRTWVGLTVAEMEELTLLVGRMDYTRMIQLAEAKGKKYMIQERKPLDDLEDPSSADCCPYCEALLHPQIHSERKPLTRDELSKLWVVHDNWLELCRAIEKAHGIKEQ